MLENIMNLYFSGAIITLFITFIVFFVSDEDIEEIDGFWDWLFFGLLWFLVAAKYLVKFLIKLFHGK